MFKNRHIELKLVQDNKTEAETVVEPVTAEELSRISRDLIKHAAVATIATIAVTFVLSTASQVIINACDRDKKDED